MSKIYSIISSIHPTNSSTQISTSTRAKAVYAVSAALKHWPGAVVDLSDDSNRGWNMLREGLSDPDPTIRRKIAFLINTLLVQSTDMPTEEDAAPKPAEKEVSDQPNEMVQKMAETRVIDALLKSVVKPLPMGPDGDISERDWDLLEKCTRALVSALERGGLDAEQRRTLGALWKGWKIDHEWENVGFTEAEAKQAMKLL
jgi:hsp70-interacting protein